MKNDRFLVKVFDKLFKMVGFKKFDKDFVESDKKWFEKKTWTNEQEKSYKNWFIKTARKDLRWSKRIAEKEYSYFNLMYGWRRK